MSSYATPEALIALGSVLPALATIIVCLRFYTRKAQKIAIMADDWWFRLESSYLNSL